MQTGEAVSRGSVSKGNVSQGGVSEDIQRSGAGNARFRAYTLKIPGTDVSFSMQPIPAGEWLAEKVDMFANDFLTANPAP